MPPSAGAKSSVVILKLLKAVFEGTEFVERDPSLADFARLVKLIQNEEAKSDGEVLSEVLHLMAPTFVATKERRL